MQRGTQRPRLHTSIAPHSPSPSMAPSQSLSAPSQTSVPGALTCRQVSSPAAAHSVSPFAQMPIAPGTVQGSPAPAQVMPVKRKT
ncbi:MAG: hypothetical protein R3B82_18460 [Sandaracinaceae bacterium]